jgi:hypothetical protein
MRHSVGATSKISKTSIKTPLIKKTKYDGEDQMSFGELRSGEIFNHLPYVYPEDIRD